MLKEAKSAMEARVSSSGNAYASRQLGASHTLAGHVAEETGGLAQLATVKHALKQVCPQVRS